MNFDSHTSGVIAGAVALVNGLTPGVARGRPVTEMTGPALRAAARDVLPTARDGRRPSSADATGLQTLAAQLRTVFEAVEMRDLDAAVEVTNRLLERYGARPHLARHDGEAWHLHFHGASAGLVDGWGAGAATGLAVVLGSAAADRLGVCRAAVCDRVYIDSSRNGTRRFCSTACQNRAKASAFRARRQAG